MTIPSLDLTPLPAAVTLPPAPPRESGPILDDSEDGTRETAFDAEFTWRGRQLQPFSIERYTAFVSLRTAMGAPSLSAAFRDGLGFYPDAIRILWICTVTPDIISALRQFPQDMEAAALAWAETHAPIHLSRDAAMLGIRIWNAAHDNKPDPRQPGTPQRKGDTSGN